MEKINVVVNGVSGLHGFTMACNVYKAIDMNLVPVSMTISKENEKISIGPKSIELIESQEINDNFELSPLFNYGRPDVFVDLRSQTPFRRKIPGYLVNAVSFVLKTGDEDFHGMIRGLDVNIFLLPVNSSPDEVLSAIRFLYKKNEAGIFRRVFSLSDIKN